MKQIYSEHIDSLKEADHKDRLYLLGLMGIFGTISMVVGWIFLWIMLILVVIVLIVIVKVVI